LNFGLVFRPMPPKFSNPIASAIFYCRESAIDPQASLRRRSAAPQRQNMASNPLLVRRKSGMDKMAIFRLILLPASDGDCMLLTWGDDGPLHHMLVDGCVSAWKKDPLGGVIGVQKGPLC
jgi:hypothetical protein